MVQFTSGSESAVLSIIECLTNNLGLFLQNCKNIATHRHSCKLESFGLRESHTALVMSCMRDVKMAFMSQRRVVHHLIHAMQADPHRDLVFGRTTLETASACYSTCFFHLSSRLNLVLLYAWNLSQKIRKFSLFIAKFEILIEFSQNLFKFLPFPELVSTTQI